MIIKAVLERIEEDNAILISDETGMEISIPLCYVDKGYYRGDEVTVTIEEKSK